MSIKQLSSRDAGLISSGEQISGLVDVLRELLANSVDAQANHIDLEVLLSNEKINLKIVDNGAGISPENMSLVGLKNYTTKFPGEMTKIETLGFRGESLNNIFQICLKSVVISRTEDSSAGFQTVFVEGVKIGEVIQHHCPVPVGTRVSLEGVFNPVKIRKDLTLSMNITDLLSNFKMDIMKTLVNHTRVRLHVALRTDKGVKHIRYNGLSLRGCDDRINSRMTLLNSLFGQISKTYEPIKVSCEEVKLEMGIGFGINQSKNYQFLFINGRPFENKKVQSQIQKLYLAGYNLWSHEELKMNGRPFQTNAIYIANFDAPVEINDFVQSPGKIVLHSKYEGTMLKLVQKAIDVFFKIEHQRARKRKTSTKRQATVKVPSLRVKMALTKTDFDDMNNTAAHQETSPLSTVRIEQLSSEHARRDVLKNDHSRHICGPHDNDRYCSLSNNRPISSHFSTETAIDRESFQRMEVVGQCDLKYIVVKLDSLLLAFDQHGVHERIRYESKLSEIVQQFNKNVMQEQALLKQPLDPKFSPGESEIVVRYSALLDRWAIRYQSGRFTHIHSLLQNKPIGAISAGILFYLEQISTGEIPRPGSSITVRHIPPFLVEASRSWACRGAVMFNQHLLREECHELMSTLQHCFSPHFCAHGRLIYRPVVTIFRPI